MAEELKDKVEEKVEEVTSDVKRNWRQKPLFKGMVYGFLALVVVLIGYTVFAASEASSSPRNDAATVVITGGK